MIKRYKRKALPARGFTLIELIVTVAILSFGIITIYEALFVSVDAFGYYTHYLDTQDWINEKISEVEDNLIQSQALETGQTSGQITRNYKMFDWTVMIDQKNETQGLYQVRVTISWKEGGRRVQTSRTAYLLPPQLRTYTSEEDSA